MLVIPKKYISNADFIVRDLLPDLLPGVKNISVKCWYVVKHMMLEMLQHHAPNILYISHHFYNTHSSVSNNPYTKMAKT